MKKKICIINGYYPEGGAGRVAYTSAKELSKKYEVYFIHCDNKERIYKEGKLRIETLKLLKKKKIIHLYFNYGIYKKLKKRLKEINPDIIHFHNIQKKSISLLTLILLSRKYKTFWTLHDQWVFCLWSYPRPPSCKYIHKNCFFCKKGPIISIINRIIKTILLKFSRIEIITPSLWLKKLCEEELLKNKTIHQIEYGITKKDFKVDNKTIKKIKKELALSEKDKILLFLGDMTNKRKGWEILVSVMKELGNENIKILLLGDKPNTLPNTKNMIFKGNVPNRLIPHYFKIAEGFILPTKADNQPVSIIEAMLFKTPVIATDSGGIPEMLENNCGIITKNNTQDIKKAIIKLISNKKLQKKIIKKGYNKALKKYSLERHVRKLKEVYQI